MLETFLNLNPHTVDGFLAVTLRNDSHKNVEAIVVLDQNLERLCLVQLLCELEDCVLVFEIDDLLDDVR